MSTDKVRIANMALKNIGKGGITSFTQTGIVAATIREEYDIARKITLSEALWNFASGWSAGQQLAIDPKPGWTYAFTYPDKAVRIFRILTSDGVPDDEIAFEVTRRMDGKDGKVIHTNVIDPIFEYTTDEEAISNYTDQFTLAFSWQLALRIAMPLTKSDKVFKRCEVMSMRYTDEAEASSANEAKDPTEEEASFHKVR